jgi:carbonic anhydrase
MKELAHLFDSNRRWVKRRTESDPQFFERLSHQQTPNYLWIGCSDSRVPANEIVGLDPGQMFVHRNVANLVVHTDLNCLSVLQFAVEVLKVEHVIVCGHYGCGGIRAALENGRLGLIDNWLRHIQDVCKKHDTPLGESDPELVDRMSALNVIEQALNVSETSIVQDAWMRGQTLHVHGWIYGIGDGILRDLDCTISGLDELDAVYQQAVAKLT